MKSKTQITTICLLILFASVQFISCKKDNSNATSSVRVKTVENAVVDSTIDSSLNKGMVAWYTFNGDTKDHSGHHNDVNFNSAKPTNGKSGLHKTAYLFSGDTSYMTVPNSTSLNPLKISIYALIKPKSFYQGPCHANYIIAKEYTDNDNGRYILGFGDQAFYNYQGCYDSVAEHHENFFGTYGNAAGEASGATDISHYIKLNHWYSLVYTFDGIYSKLYVNGALVSKVVKSTTFTPNENPLYIGRNEDPNAPYYFSGVIDEVRIYKKVLSANQVLTLYNSTKN